jgi:hypothetical protein
MNNNFSVNMYYNSKKGALGIETVIALRVDDEVNLFKTTNQVIKYLSSRVPRLGDKINYKYSIVPPKKDNKGEIFIDVFRESAEYDSILLKYIEVQEDILNFHMIEEDGELWIDNTIYSSPYNYKEYLKIFKRAKDYHQECFQTNIENSFFKNEEINVRDLFLKEHSRRRKLINELFGKEKEGIISARRIAQNILSNVR